MVEGGYLHIERGQTLHICMWLISEDLTPFGAIFQSFYAELYERNRVTLFHLSLISRSFGRFK